jgi:hypothetical protein
MPFKERISVYCENRMKHIIKICGKNAELLYVKAGGTYSNHPAVEGQKR